MHDINLRHLNGIDYDQPFGFSTGAGVFFIINITFSLIIKIIK